MKFIGHGELNKKLTELHYMQGQSMKIVIDDVKVADERASQLVTLDDVAIKKEGDHVKHE